MRTFHVLSCGIRTLLSWHQCVTIHKGCCQSGKLSQILRSESLLTLRYIGMTDSLTDRLIAHLVDISLQSSVRTLNHVVGLSGVARLTT